MRNTATILSLLFFAGCAPKPIGAGVVFSNPPQTFSVVKNWNGSISIETP